MSSIPFGVKTGWWSFELPGYRPHPRPATYSLFSYKTLPTIQQDLGSDFQWLKSQSAKQRSLLEGCYSDGSKPDLSKLSTIVGQLAVSVPRPFSGFIQTAELQQRIRSCTDCYLDVADRATITKGALEGYLIHFLSDSQWCGHWYLHLDHLGRESVFASLTAYGFEFGESKTIDEIDLTAEDVWFCAPSFVEFIYRFWLENEIWHALASDKRPLTKTEQAYADHYSQFTETTA